VASHPGHQRDFYSQRPSLLERAIPLGGQRPKSPDLEEVLFSHEQRSEAGVGIYGDGYVGSPCPGSPTKSPPC